MKGKAVAYIVLGLVLLIEIPRFYGTYAQIDPDLLGLPLTAIGTGIALPLGAAYVFHTWWMTTRQKRDWLVVAFAILLALEGVILIPWGMARLQDESLTAVVGSGLLAWGWIGVVMLSPFAVVGAVMMAMSFQKESRTKPVTVKVKHDDAAEAQGDATPEPMTFTTKAEHVAWLHERQPELQPAELMRQVGCSASTVTRGMGLASQNGSNA